MRSPNAPSTRTSHRRVRDRGRGMEFQGWGAGGVQSLPAVQLHSASPGSLGLNRPRKVLGDRRIKRAYNDEPRGRDMGGRAQQFQGWRTATDDQGCHERALGADFGNERRQRTTTTTMTATTERGSRVSRVNRRRLRIACKGVMIRSPVTGSPQS